MQLEKNENRIFSTQYFGDIAFYATLLLSKSCQIERFENYQKRSLRNRLHILGPQGVDILSIPLVKGKNAQSLITTVEISYEEDWPRQHIQALQSYYGKSAFFEYYIDGIAEILHSGTELLWEMNTKICTYICKCLSIDQELTYTHGYFANYTYDFRDSKSDIYTEMRSGLLNTLRYSQVFEEKHGFTPNLSVLDLLFCCGPEANLLLNRLVLP